MRCSPHFLLLALLFPVAAHTGAFAQEPAPVVASAEFAPFDGAVAADTISRKDLDRDVVIHGAIVKVEASTGDRVPYRLTLAARDADPVLVVYWPDSAATIHGGKTTPVVGTEVSAKGRLMEYRGALQVRVQDPANIKIAGYQQLPAAPKPAAPAPAAPAGSTNFTPFAGAVDPATVTIADLGKDVVLSGTIAEIAPSTGDRVPYRITLVQRDPNPVMVVYWPDLAPTLHGTKSAPAVGTKVSAKGRLADYRGALQVRIQDVGSIRIDGYTPAQAAPAPNTPAAAANGPVPDPDADGYYAVKDVAAQRSLFGSTISLRGTVSGFRPAGSDRAPSTISLADGGAKIDVVYWNAEKAPIPDFTKSGTPIFATGKLGMYRESVQLAVDDLANMSITPLDKKRVAGKPAPPLTLAPGAKATDGWPGTQKEMDRSYLTGAASGLKAKESASLNSIGRFEAGTEVSATGTITSVRSSETGGFVDIADSTGAITILVSAENAQTLAYGSKVEATGLLEWDSTRAQTVLRATTVRRVE